MMDIVGPFGEFTLGIWAKLMEEDEEATPATPRNAKSESLFYAPITSLTTKHRESQGLQFLGTVKVMVNMGYGTCTYLR